MTTIREEIEKYNLTLKPEVKKSMEESIIKMFEQNQTPQDFFKLNDFFIETLYESGYHYYQNGKYQEALCYFNFLCDLNPLSFRYMFAMAACYQKMENYLQAYDYYLMCTYLDEENPLPYFHLFGCCIEQKEYDNALHFLKQVILYTIERPEYEKLRERALLEEKNLLQQESRK